MDLAPSIPFLSPSTRPAITIAQEHARPLLIRETDKALEDELDKLLTAF